MNYQFGAQEIDVNTAREKERIVDLLSIPVSSLVFSSFFCEIFIGVHSIGCLQFDHTPQGLQYDTTKASLQKIDWKRVYQYCAVELNALIQSEIKLRSFKVVAASFGRLFVEDETGNLIASFHCSYKNSVWKISNEGILA